MIRSILKFTCFAWTAVLPLSGVAQATEMPPVPAVIEEADVLRVGTKCDFPPYGFLDDQGNYAGIEVDMGRQIAEWALGSADKVVFTCVTSENRIQQLTSRKLDILIATLGVTPERGKVIDFSVPYRWDGSDLLVPKDSAIERLEDLDGKTVTLLKGTIQAKWFDDNMPDVENLRLNSVSDALQALQQGRVDAYSHDRILLVGLAANNDDFRLVGDLFAAANAAIGVRKNEADTLAYMSASIERMRSEGVFRDLVRKWVEGEGMQNAHIDQFESEKPDSR